MINGNISIIKIAVSRVGDRCTRHYDCTAPFSACLNSQCVCISGTVQQGTKCVATPNCPLGGTVSMVYTVNDESAVDFNEDVVIHRFKEVLKADQR